MYKKQIPEDIARDLQKGLDESRAEKLVEPYKNDDLPPEMYKLMQGGAGHYLTLGEVKDLLNKLPDRYLSQNFIVFEDGEEQGNALNTLDITEEDIYWQDGECYGNEENAKQEAEAWYEDDMPNMTEPFDWEKEKKKFDICPRGTIHWFYGIPEDIDTIINRTETKNT